MSATLTQWLQLRHTVTAFKPTIDAERKLRAQLFGEHFPDPHEGTNNVTLDSGGLLKATYPLERKVDEALLASLRVAEVGQLSVGMRAALHMEHVAHDLPVVLALRLNVDELLKYEPSVVIKKYRELTAEQRTFFDCCLTIKPGSMSLEYLPPVATEAAT